MARSKKVDTSQGVSGSRRVTLKMPTFKYEALKRAAEIEEMTATGFAKRAVHLAVGAVLQRQQETAKGG